MFLHQEKLKQELDYAAQPERNCALVFKVITGKICHHHWCQHMPLSGQHVSFFCLYVPSLVCSACAHHLWEPLSSQSLLPSVLASSPSTRPVAPLPHFLPPDVQSPLLWAALRGWGELSPVSGSGWANAPWADHLCTSEPWSSKGSLAGQASTGADKTNPVNWIPSLLKSAKLFPKTTAKYFTLQIYYWTNVLPLLCQ